MAMREIVVDGDPILRKKSRPVEKFDEKLATLLDDMAETMYFENRGIGIAAPQVGVLRRVFIVDVGDDHGLIEFINPEITYKEGSQIGGEGCLSVPGKTCEVDRPQKIRVKALDRNGNEFELEAEDLLARCICHENDHLDGILFIDKSVDGKVYRIEDEDGKE